MHPPCKGQVPHRSTHCNVEGRIAVVLWCLQPRQNILAHSLRWAGTRHDGRGHPNQECRQFPKRAFWKNPMQRSAGPAWNTDATNGTAGWRAGGRRLTGGGGPAAVGGGGAMAWRAWKEATGPQQAPPRWGPSPREPTRPPAGPVPLGWTVVGLVSLAALGGGVMGGSSMAVNPPPPSYH